MKKHEMKKTRKTHAGFRDGGTYSVIADLETNATALDGLAVAGENAEDAEEYVTGWLAALGYGFSEAPTTHENAKTGV